MENQEYYYTKNNESIGPLSLMELLEVIDRETMVWKEGIEWTIACDIDELKKFFPASVCSIPVMMYYYSSESNTYGPFDLAQLLYKIDGDTLVWREGINWTKACDLSELHKFFPAKVNNEISELSNSDDFISTKSNGDLIKNSLKNDGAGKKALIIAGTVVAIVIIGGSVFFGLSGRAKKIATPITQEASKIKSVSAQSIVLDVSSKKLKVAEKLQLKVTITPQNTIDQNLVWESGDNSVATVSNGLVTTLSKGTTEVKASLSNTSLFATCKIIVEDIAKKEIKPPVENTLGFGTYNGETKNGKAHGMGTLHYSQRHLISIRDRQERYAESGDYLLGDFYNGEVVQGKLFDKNNNQKAVIIVGRPN